MFIISTGGVVDVEVMSKIEVCVKYRVDGGKFYGIALTQQGQITRSPIYPFADQDRLSALEEFLTLFKKELMLFYRDLSYRGGFAQFLFPFNTERKENFRNYWFSKGVIIY